MSWFSKKLKKVTKVIDPVGAKLRKGTGGSYGDPMNWYQSGPKPVVPYERGERPGLLPNPGTSGPGIQLGNTTGYQPNPFASQMAQANVLRNGPGMNQQNMIPGPQAQVGMAPPSQMAPQNMQNTMMRPGGRPPGMAF